LFNYNLIDIFNSVKIQFLIQTTINGGYNDKELFQLMGKPNSKNEIPTSMKAAIEKCEKEGMYLLQFYLTFRF